MPHSISFDTWACSAPSTEKWSIDALEHQFQPQLSRTRLRFQAAECDFVNEVPPFRHTRSKFSSFLGGEQFNPASEDSTAGPADPEKVLNEISAFLPPAAEESDVAVSTSGGADEQLDVDATVSSRDGAQAQVEVMDVSVPTGASPAVSSTPMPGSSDASKLMEYWTFTDQYGAGGADSHANAQDSHHAASSLPHDARHHSHHHQQLHGRQHAHDQHAPRQPPAQRLAQGPPAQGPPAEGPPAEGPPAEGPPADGPLAEAPPADGPPESAPGAPVATVILQEDDDRFKPLAALGGMMAVFGQIYLWANVFVTVFKRERSAFGDTDTVSGTNRSERQQMNVPQNAGAEQPAATFSGASGQASSQIARSTPVMEDS